MNKIKRLGLSAWIFLAMICGLLSGLWVFHTFPLPVREQLAQSVSIGSDIFLHLIKMVITPLVFTLLASGIAKMGDINKIGRVGSRAMLWFIIASIVSLIIGMILMNSFHIGKGIVNPKEWEAAPIPHTPLTPRSFILHIFPKSIIKAMADNEVLQVVVFALFFGIAGAALGDRAKKVVHILGETGEVLLKIIAYVMYVTPMASFSAMFSVVAIRGGSVIQSYLFLILLVFGGLLMLWILLIIVGYIFLKRRIFELLYMCRIPFLIAFSTSSSESAYPLVIQKLRRFGCSDKIVNFVLPLGYSFNLDGSMMYTSIAALFIAQVYGIHLDMGTQLTLLFFLLITSKGIAAVPRASLVIIGGALTAFNIPEAGLALLVGVDAILDMGRTVTNIMGNTVASAVISKIENELIPPAV